MVWHGLVPFDTYFVDVMFLQHFVQGINHCKSKAGEREFGFHLTFFSQPYALFIFFYFFILSLFICIIFFLPVQAFSCEFFIFCFFLPSLHFLNG